MKINVCIFLVLTGFIAGINLSQAQATRYDDLPSINVSLKPAYSQDFPDWAKMLYSETTNFNEISAGFQAYEREHPGEESAIIRYFKIWSRAVEPYVLDDGSIQMPDPEKVQQQLFKTQTSGNNARSTNSPSDWSFVGPKETYWLNENGQANPPGACSWQANVYSFDVSNSNNNILYAGTETGFMNKSTDKGLHWQLLASGYPFGGGISATAIHPSNPDIVYAAAGNQMHKSTDGGNSWMPLLPAGNLFYADRIRIASDNPNKIVAASSKGVFVSTDAGETWIKKWTTAAYDVEFKPGNSNMIYALVRTASGTFSIVESQNSGSSFTAISNFPTGINDASGGLLAVTEDEPNRLFVIMLSSNNSNTPYLYSGQNSAGTWTWQLLATGKTSALRMDNGQGYFDLVLDVSPLNSNIILVGTTTLYKSTNGGTNFQAVGGYTGAYNIHPDIQDIKMMTTGDTWVSTDGGMTLTTDNFTSTQNYYALNNDLTGSDFWGFDQGWNEDIVVGGRYHNGNTAVADFYGSKALRMGGAESPTGWVLQGKSRHVAFSDLGNGWILPAAAEGKPEGRFIFSKYPNMDEYGGRRGNIVHHPFYYGTFYLGEENGFWKSTDMGQNYELLYTFPGRVRYLQISYHNPDVLYADIVSYGLYRSSDGGVTWQLKPTLTNGSNGTTYWKGRLFFSISLFDENTVYATLQNGTWSSDLGKIFRSTNGGDTWENWSGSFTGYTKCLVIQPVNDTEEIVYLFTTSREGEPAKVYYRSSSMNDWTEFCNNYPAGISVNMAFPFFRDGKLRVGGSAGVWESPLMEQTFTPIIKPWIEKQHYDCILDTLYFDDHSVLNHAGASWHWEISPQPSYISNADIRNPKVVPGTEGSYSVTLKVTQNGITYTASIPDMVSVSACPSIYDCDNPAYLDKTAWRLMYVDSEETSAEDGSAINAFDNDPETIWHTQWVGANPPPPHEIQFDLGRIYKLSTFTYLPRQNGENGRIKSYEIYLSNDSTQWGMPVKTGLFTNTANSQSVDFEPAVEGQYLRFRALSEVNDNPWTSAAEFSVKGCINNVGNGKMKSSLVTAFPVPSDGKYTLVLPENGNDLQCRVINTAGQVVYNGIASVSNPALDLSRQPSGVYLVILSDENGANYRIKVIKN